MSTLFEKATRQKLRFNTTRGVVAVEDLWDLSLETLDGLAQTINKQVKATQEESFIKVKSSSTSLAARQLQLKLDILVHIINVKVDEKEKRDQEAVKKTRKAEIMELLDKKRTEAMSAKSEKELIAELAALD